ncbi:hypothetical protein N7486_006766 [Penicillium sp. IBT 16267x]|nr:hypothetical protein N7486_006766 [Penicillium sp. IBT 16267x]
MGSTSDIDLDNIQGDIWPGLSKRYQQFFFFHIDNAAALKPVLKTLADEVITSATGALHNRAAIHKAKAPASSGLGIAGDLINIGVDLLEDIYNHLPAPHEIKKAKGSDDVSITGVNISFTVKGMTKLSEGKFKDDPFLKGMFADMVGEGRDEAKDWVPWFKDGSVDGVVLVCGTEHEVKAKTQELAQKYFCPSHGVRHLLTLDGNERPGDQKGHEHFGYLDGISQPLIEGLDDETSQLEGHRKWMTRPGIILFGHKGEMDDEPKLKHPAWAKDGSILVVRKIKQFVPEWNSFVQKEAPRLNFTPDQFGARLVGRWKSGAPVQMHPDKDFPAHARWNDFDYPTDDHTNCPFASHMRKTKPRSLVNNVDKFDIMRRGIPYGPELGPDEKEKTKQDRGLMFLCYQTSLSNGFQFIRNRWINPDTFPSGKTAFTGGMNPGQDPVVGQSVKGAIEDDDKLLQVSIFDGNKKHNQVTFMPFIESNGGDYFFTPSLKLMRELAVAPAA